MPKVYFKISHSYFKENLNPMLRSCIDTGAVYTTFYRTLVPNTGGKIEDVVNENRPIQVRVIIINASDQYMNAYLTFRIEEHEKKYKTLHRKRFVGKVLYDGGEMITFEADIGNEVFKVITAIRP